MTNLIKVAGHRDRDSYNTVLRRAHPDLKPSFCDIEIAAILSITMTYVTVRH